MSLQLLNEYIVTLGWIFALVIILSVAFPILVLLFDKLVGKIDVIKELKKKNMAVSLLLSVVIIGVTLIILSTL
jgi:uncharacterized membrane protein YjfL (UPF0719 family)